MLKTRLTLQPGRAGTKKMLAQYGSKLVCVRYRYDEELEIRCKTVELIVEQVAWRPKPRVVAPRPDDIVHILLSSGEKPLREAIKRRGAKWNRDSRTWSVTYATATSLRLTDRITTLPPAPSRPPIRPSPATAP